MKTFTIGRSGLCAELQNLIGFYYKYIHGTENKIHVESASPYFRKFCISSLFQFPNNFTFGRRDLVKHKREKLYHKYFPFGFTFDYTENFKSEIDNIINELILPDSYVCAHIRRGDKVGEKECRQASTTGVIEGKRFESSDYIHYCPTNIDTIFLMTDDYKSIKEAKEFIDRQKLSLKVLHLTKESQDGHSEKENNKKIYLKQELLQFFAEIEIAKKSSTFIGTRSSNVYRYIKKSYKPNCNFVQLD